MYNTQNVDEVCVFINPEDKLEIIYDVTNDIQFGPKTKAELEYLGREEYHAIKIDGVYYIKMFRNING